MGSSRSTSASCSLRHAVAAALLAALVLSRRWHLPGAAAQPADGWHEEPEPLDVRVGLLANDNKPFTQPSPQAQPNSAGLEGFEVDLMHALCRRAALNCTAVPVQTIEERLPQLAAGAYDVAIAALSFTPGRAAVAHFPRPFYYSSGASLYAASNAAGLRVFSGAGSKPGAEVEGWRGVFTGNFPVGQTLCLVQGHYATPFILADYDGSINLDLSPTLDAAAAKARSGACSAVVYDTASPMDAGTPLAGLQRLPAPPAYVSPYGVALRLEDAGSELERRLVWALVGVMSAGEASEVMELERRWLVPSLGANSALAQVVESISTFGPTRPASVPPSYSLWGRTPGGR